MGSIRVLLATSVILGHLFGYWGLESHYQSMLHHYFMVQIFFVISGFYIAMVLAEKYSHVPNSTMTFYSQRYLRLMPSFLLISLFTLAFLFFSPDIMPIGRIFNDDFAIPTTWDAWSRWLLIIVANVSLIGIDLLELLDIFGEPGKHFLIIPQAWSLGCELWFYILSPFIILWSNSTLVLLCIGSFLLRFVFASAEMPFFPWQQRFFGTEIMFFIFGIFSYRFYKYFKIEKQAATKILGHALAFTFAVVIMADSLMIPWLNSLSPWNSLFIALYTMLAIPFIFAVSRFSRFDRILGELSYLMYLWHIVLGHMFRPYLELWHGFFLVVVSIIFSIPVLFLIEIPMERVRRNMLLNKRSVTSMAVAN